ncbi:DUF6176 family protein [Lysinibacillus sp. RS5]|uniref:DUF6176 family protein n=1 Tax=unclassified Lysinibacillus TaxID=2636778 RepID=UPI0035BE7EA2
MKIKLNMLKYSRNNVVYKRKEQSTMNIECTRYRVKQNKTDKVNEWLVFLNENMEDVLVNLKGEKMYVEMQPLNL